MITPVHAPGGLPDETAARILVLDDEAEVQLVLSRFLEHEGHRVTCASGGRTALDEIERGRYDVLVCDIRMPEMNGIDVLRAIRARGLDVAVILLTGAPRLETALDAVALGAARYLVKPVDRAVLTQAVREALQLHRLARLRQRALEVLATGEPAAERGRAEMLFQRALDSLWIAYQPIVRAADGRVHACEALVRTEEPTLLAPHDLIAAAERLGRVGDLGRAVRSRVARCLAAHPGNVFVNLHPLELADEHLIDGTEELGKYADRVVLEATERAPLERAGEPGGRLAALRARGFRVALDDVGAGYSGLNAFAQLRPDVVKLDIGLVHGVHRDPTRHALVRGMIGICHELGILVVAEGVESSGEAATLTEAGCDLLQGYLFGRPARRFIPTESQ